MGGIFSLARDFLLLSIGFVGGYYISEKQHRQSLSFQGIGKKLDGAISDIEREIRGQPQPTLEQYATDALNILTKPAVAFFNEITSWFNTGGFPSAEFTR